MSNQRSPSREPSTAMERPSWDQYFMTITRQVAERSTCQRAKVGAVMPGKGKAFEREYSVKEREAIAKGAAASGLSEQDAFKLIGERTLDVYLNNLAYWKNVPLRVWDYTIGGYQVIKKWLSYRERGILGRGLSIDEVHTVTEIARRIASILLLQPQLDANYDAVTRSTFPWPSP